MRTVDGVTWALLVDALGHGDSAADAADHAIDEAEGFGAGLSVEGALRQLHQRLIGTRGAAAALLRFEAGAVTLGGVGNVEVRTLDGPTLPYVAGRGVLGARLPRLHTNQTAIEQAGRILMFTDGIDRRAPLSQLARLGPELLCTRLLTEHSDERDDATMIHLGFRP